jgi:hypothetical protein
MKTLKLMDKQKKETGFRAAGFSTNYKVIRLHEAEGFVRFHPLALIPPFLNLKFFEEEP